MGYYENLKCGNCGHSFTNGYVRSNGFLKTYMGLPYIKCDNCNFVNNTGFRPYSTFHWVEKLYHWFSEIFRYTIFGLGYGILVAGIYHKFLIKDEKYIDSVSAIIIFFIVILHNYYFIKLELKEIDFVEDKYNEMT